MDDNDDITFDGQADESQLNSPAPEEAVSNVSAVEALTLEELNTFLGKDFKNKDTALKSLKDTYSYVGKRKEDILKEVSGTTEQTARELKEIKENMFYDRNPQYAEYRDLIQKMGANPQEVAESPEFKKIFEKAKGYDENQKLKSVLVSNPRLAQSKDNLGKAAEAMQNGQYESAENLIARAVLDASQ